MRVKPQNSRENLIGKASDLQLKHLDGQLDGKQTATEVTRVQNKMDNVWCLKKNSCQARLDLKTEPSYVLLLIRLTKTQNYREVQRKNTTNKY